MGLRLRVVTEEIQNQYNVHFFVQTLHSTYVLIFNTTRLKQNTYCICIRSINNAEVEVGTCNTVGARGMVLSEFQEVWMTVTSLGGSSMQDFIYFAPMIQMIKQNNGPRLCSFNKAP
jgi:hypothetical protein